MSLVASSAAAAVSPTATASRGGTITLDAIISGALEQIEINLGVLAEIVELTDGLSALKAKAKANAIKRVAGEAKEMSAMADRIRKAKRGPKLRERRFRALLVAARFVLAHPGQSFDLEEWFVRVTNGEWDDGELQELRGQWSNREKVIAELGASLEQGHFTRLEKRIRDLEAEARPRFLQAVRTLQAAGHLHYDAEAGKITHLNRS